MYVASFFLVRARACVCVCVCVCVFYLFSITNPWGRDAFSRRTFKMFRFALTCQRRSFWI